MTSIGFIEKGNDFGVVVALGGDTSAGLGLEMGVGFDDETALGDGFA